VRAREQGQGAGAGGGERTQGARERAAATARAPAAPIDSRPDLIYPDSRYLLPMHSPPPSFMHETEALLYDPPSSINMSSPRLDYIWTVGQHDLFDGMKTASRVRAAGRGLARPFYAAAGAVAPDFCNL
jgi:hypothetical protein